MEGTDVSVGADLLRYSDVTLLPFDFESQRLNVCHDNLPFQLSWLVAKRNRILETHNHYLHWENFVMSPDAAMITRFDPRWVKNGDDPTMVLDKWETQALGTNTLLIGSNILSFDCPLWNLWRRHMGRPATWAMLPQVIDIHLLARAFKLGIKPDRENLLAWQYKVNNNPVKGVKTGLSTMATEFKIDFDPNRLHEAEYDLGLTLQVYWKLVNLMEI